MGEFPEIHFTGESDDFLSFKALGRSHPEATDSSDGNWLRIWAKVSVGDFQGNVSGDIHLVELQAFSNAISQFHETLTGEALLEVWEGWLKLRVSADKLGQIQLSGFLKNGFYLENSLNFVLYTDQTFLTTPIKQIKCVLKEYPFRGDLRVIP